MSSGCCTAGAWLIFGDDVFLDNGNGYENIYTRPDDMADWSMQVYGCCSRIVRVFLSKYFSGYGWRYWAVIIIDGKIEAQGAATESMYCGINFSGFQYEHIAGIVLNPNWDYTSGVQDPDAFEIYYITNKGAYATGIVGANLDARFNTDGSTSYAKVTYDFVNRKVNIYMERYGHLFYTNFSVDDLTEAEKFREIDTAFDSPGAPNAIGNIFCMNEGDNRRLYVNGAKVATIAVNSVQGFHGGRNDFHNSRAGLSRQ